MRLRGPRPHARTPTVGPPASLTPGGRARPTFSALARTLSPTRSLSFPSRYSPRSSPAASRLLALTWRHHPWGSPPSLALTSSGCRALSPCPTRAPTTDATDRPASPSTHPRLATLTVQNASLTIIMHYARVANTGAQYSAATAVLLSELLKGASKWPGLALFPPCIARIPAGPHASFTLAGVP